MAVNSLNNKESYVVVADPTTREIAFFHFNFNNSTDLKYAKRDASTDFKASTLDKLVFTESSTTTDLMIHAQFIDKSIYKSEFFMYGIIELKPADDTVGFGIVTQSITSLRTTSMWADNFLE